MKFTNAKFSLNLFWYTAAEYEFDKFTSYSGNARRDADVRNISVSTLC